jgi:nucleoside-diphosphate-sugar epimerase
VSHIVVTGSTGHLGEALVRVLRSEGREVVGIDVSPSAHTSVVGSIVDRALVRECVRGASAVIHTATLHKPHVASHSKQDFVETNVTGTLALLEESIAAGVQAFVFTSTTSAFGRALSAPPGAPATWITEDVTDVPKNIYGATKHAAEDLCELMHREHGLPVVVLRTARFFREADDSDTLRAEFDDSNLKTNEFLYRRLDVADVVTAHQAAVARAATIGFARYVISSTTPFARSDTAELGRDAAAVVARLFPSYADEYARRGWRMHARIDRVYDNARARAELGWTPKHDFSSVLAALRAGTSPHSELARAIGTKGYHQLPTGVYTTR